jgi:hypothetical protein
VAEKDAKIAEALQKRERERVPRDFFLLYQKAKLSPQLQAAALAQTEKDARIAKELHSRDLTRAATLRKETVDGDAALARRLQLGNRAIVCVLRR